MIQSGRHVKLPIIDILCSYVKLYINLHLKTFQIKNSALHWSGLTPGPRSWVFIRRPPPPPRRRPSSHQAMAEVVLVVFISQIFGILCAQAGYTPMVGGSCHQRREYVPRETLTVYR